MQDATNVVRIQANGIEMNVAVLGSGPALLLLHGFPHTWRLWSEVMEPLSRRWQVIAPDLRGLGGHYPSGRRIRRRQPRHGHRTAARRH